MLRFLYGKLILLIMFVFRLFGTDSLQIESFTHKISGLPPHLEGTTIVHLTDFHQDFPHFPKRITPQLLEEVVLATNRLQPDLILLTGDYVQLDPEPIAELVPVLKRLQSRLGTFAVLGNHDNRRPHAKPMIVAALENAGIRVLQNEVVTPLGPGFEIVGLGDRRDFKPTEALFNSSESESTPRIVLSHNPDTAALLRQYRVDLQLSGHSHGGQICFPNGTAVLSYVKAIVDACLPLRARGRIAAKLPYHAIANWTWASGYHKIERSGKFDDDSAEAEAAATVIATMHGYGYADNEIDPSRIVEEKLPFVAQPRNSDEGVCHSNNNSTIPAARFNTEHPLDGECASPATRFNFLYTNRGLATHPPCRLFCRPELTHITLTSGLPQDY